MALSVAKNRLAELTKLQCSLFQTTYNPTQQRLGNKILRQRLKGPQLAAYYPRRSATVQDLFKDLKKVGMEGWIEAEEYRLEGVKLMQLRGKGAPKKKRTADVKKGRKKK